MQAGDEPAPVDSIEPITCWSLMEPPDAPIDPITCWSLMEPGECVICYHPCAEFVIDCTIT